MIFAVCIGRVKNNLGNLASTLHAAGLFWLNSAHTDTVAGARNVNGLLFHILAFCSFRVITPLSTLKFE